MLERVIRGAGVKRERGIAERRSGGCADQLFGLRVINRLVMVTDRRFGGGREEYFVQL